MNPLSDAEQIAAIRQRYPGDAYSGQWVMEQDLRFLLAALDRVSRALQEVRAEHQSCLDGDAGWADKWHAKYQHESQIVDEVWAALGISTIEQAEGKHIATIVSELRAFKAAADAALRRITQPQQEEWQPIDTAPKDGAEILAFHDRGDGTLSYEVLRYDGGEWSDGEYTFCPTHWRPLPAPPNEEDLARVAPLTNAGVDGQDLARSDHEPSPSLPQQRLCLMNIRKWVDEAMAIHRRWYGDAVPPELASDIAAQVWLHVGDAFANEQPAPCKCQCSRAAHTYYREGGIFTACKRCSCKAYESSPGVVPPAERPE